MIQPKDIRIGDNLTLYRDAIFPDNIQIMVVLNGTRLEGIVENHSKDGYWEKGEIVNLDESFFESQNEDWYIEIHSRRSEI